MGRVGSTGALSAVLQVLSIGCGVAIVVIVATKLWQGFTWEGVFTTGSGNVCFLTTESWNACAYAYVLAAVSWIISLFIIAAQCAKGACRVAEIALALFALAWWIAGATVGTVYGTQADDWMGVGWPEQGYRTAVWALGWAQVGLFALTLLASCASGKAPRKEEKPAAPAPAAPGNYPTGAYTAGAGGPPAYTSNPTYVSDYPPPPPPNV